MTSVSPPPHVGAIAKIEAVPTILQVIAETTGLRFACVARVTPSLWQACAVHDGIGFGMKVGDELKVETTLCHEVRSSLEAILIEHAAREAAFCSHPTPKMYGFESYLSVPLFRRDGEYFGTLCGLDPQPQPLRDRRALEMMTLFAQLISLQLDVDEKLATTEAALVAERDTATMREQFIAVLAHDVRSPLASITTGVAVLLGMALPEPVLGVARRMGRSARRIDRLVEQVLDLARGRLGGGLPLALVPVSDLTARVQQVVDEIASAHPDRSLEVSLDDIGTAEVDPVRIEQIVSNLLANAIEHGDPAAPVAIALQSTPDAIVLRVHNTGRPIPPDELSHLFEPFARGPRRPGSRGLGLGLFIVHEIVRAHGGTVDVTSTAGAGT
ncbi:MAG: GAF domain-containing sensor histidine kinase, partial [Myxococcales bacterium]